MLACAGSRSNPAIFGPLAASIGARVGRSPPRGARPAGPVVNSLPQRLGAAADLRHVSPKKPAIAHLLFPAVAATKTLTELACTSLYILSRWLSIPLIRKSRQRLSLSGGVGSGTRTAHRRQAWTDHRSVGAHPLEGEHERPATPRRWRPRPYADHRRDTSALGKLRQGERHEMNTPNEAEKWRKDGRSS